MSMQELLKMLMEEGQQHICAFWAPAGTRDAEKKVLVQQLLAADGTYPGGLRAYIRSAKQLLTASKEGRNPFEGCRVSVPDGLTLSVEDTEALEQCERDGVRAAADCAFVLVAGGLGERLGYHGIKVRCPPFIWRTAYMCMQIAVLARALRCIQQQCPLFRSLRSGLLSHESYRLSNFFDWHPSAPLLAAC